MLLHYLNSKPLGLGFLAPKSNTKMTADDAQKYLDKGRTNFDYLEGRLMKINVSEDEMDPSNYDLENGQGAANKIVEAIRKSQSLEFKLAVPTDALEKAAASGNSSETLKLAHEQITIFSLKL